MSILTKFVDRAFAVLGAVTFMQAPQFIQNYTISLSGHLAELTWQLDQLRQMARKSGRTLTDLVTKFIANDDPDVKFQGEMINNLIQRETSFNDAILALSNANPFSRPFEFMTHFHWDVVKESSMHYQLGLPLTIESIIWGVIGLFAGYLLFRSIVFIAYKLNPRKKQYPIQSLPKT